MFVRAAVILPLMALCLPAESGWAQQTTAIHLPATPRATAPDASVVADSLLLAMEPRAALEVLQGRLEWKPSDYEARWRAARLAMVFGIVERDRSRRIAWYRAAAAHGLAAMEAHPSGIDGRLWTAVAKGRLAIETGGVREKARLGSEVWDLTEGILETSPDHPMANDVRGKLNQEVMKLDGVSRFMGKMVLRSDPLRYGDWASAEAHLRKALLGDPGMILFYLDLGETYLAQEKWREAVRTFEEGLVVPDRYPTDPHFKSIMRHHLERLRVNDPVR